MRTQLRRTGTQFSRFAVNNRDIIGFAQREITASAALSKFSLADCVSGPPDHTTGVRGVQRTRQIEGVREQIVAQQHARFVVPACITRVQVTSQSCLVQNIIMDQRGGVDHFHHSSTDQMRVINLAGSLCDQQ